MGEEGRLSLASGVITGLVYISSPHRYDRTWDWRPYCGTCRCLGLHLLQRSSSRSSWLSFATDSYGPAPHDTCKEKQVVDYQSSVVELSRTRRFEPLKRHAYPPQLRQNLLARIFDQPFTWIYGDVRGQWASMAGGRPALSTLWSFPCRKRQTNIPNLDRCKKIVYETTQPAPKVRSSTLRRLHGLSIISTVLVLVVWDCEQRHQAWKHPVTMQHWLFQFRPPIRQWVFLPRTQPFEYRLIVGTGMDHLRINNESQFSHS